MAIKRQMRNYAPTDLTFPKGKSYRPRVLVGVYSKTLKHAPTLAREYFIFNSYSLYIRSNGAIYTPLHLLPLSVIANLCSAFTDLSGRCCSVSITATVQSQQCEFIFILSRLVVPLLDGHARSQGMRMIGNLRKSRGRKVDNWKRAFATASRQGSAFD